tara:strand:- start:7933 stop:8526 length:594 start_codon:yes stop_codon:yes gene_type:complete
MFWLYNYLELFNPILIPKDYMTFEEKLNSIMRIILFSGIVLALIFNDYRYILFIIILLFISIFIYNYQQNILVNNEKFLDENNLTIIDSESCVKPTKNNPMMNVNIYDKNKNIKSCNVNNKNVSKKVNNLLNCNIYRNDYDIYNTNILNRIFYTMPSTTIPNEQNKFGNWLYNRGKSCKENNGEQCYNNLYSDIKVR